MRVVHADGVEIELLIVPDCPHERSAHDLVRAALDELNLAASLITTVIETDDQAQERGFTGSPTFLVNGCDPFAEPNAVFGVACRVYGTSAGLAGVPSLGELREALQRAVTTEAISGPADGRV